MNDSRDKDATGADALTGKLHKAIGDYAKAMFAQDEAGFRDVGYTHGHLFADSLSALATSRREVERLSSDIERHIAIAAELATENERLREAVRKYGINGPVALGDGRSMSCFLCHGSWHHNDPESHAPGCLAALSAQGQQEPTGDSSGG